MLFFERERGLLLDDILDIQVYCDSQLDAHKNSSTFNTILFLCFVISLIHGYCLLFSCSFNIFCIYICAKFFNLLVFACCTLNFSSFLVPILCSLEFRGNIFLAFSFLRHRFANFKQSCFLLSCNVSSSKK